MLNYEYNDHNFIFSFLNDKGEIALQKNWKDFHSEFLSELAILNELHDNGFAEFTDDACVLSDTQLLVLDELDKRILGLPPQYPFEILIEQDGNLIDKTFKFKYGFYNFTPNGTKLKACRDRVFVEIENDLYLLSENQYKICELIEEFNNSPIDQKGGIENYKKLIEIKNLAINNRTTFDPYLSNQDLHSPDKVKLDIDFKNGFLEIIPEVDIDNKSAFTAAFDKFGTVRNQYPISGPNGETKRVLLSRVLIDDLQNLKKNRKVSDPKKIQEIVEHPELYFNQENIDYSVFYSDRVKEIGLYTPKYYPFVSPYKSKWIPGILIKDKIHGEQKIHISTPEKLDELIVLREKAVDIKENTIKWNGSEIPLEVADKLIDTAKRQFKDTSKPIAPINKSEPEVLIIKENAETMEYIQSGQLKTKFDLKYSLISNLAPGLELKTHQKHGVAWLQTLLKENQSGGLLADDMGLGKTLQLLYFIEWHAQNFDSDKPYLIVAPVSLLENWENEYNKFFKPQSLSITKLYGKVSLTKSNEPAKNLADAKRLQCKQIILTNYETLRNYQISLGLVDFAIIALDEAQKIKTPGTLITNACKALKADFKIAMTGTPVENTLVDIWCILDFAVPGLLGNGKEFVETYQKPLEDPNTNRTELTEALRKNIGDFILRRLKSDVAKDLPKKFDNEFSRKKRTMFPEQLSRYKQEIELANNKDIKGVEKRNQILKSIWAIRDISDHPYLLNGQIFSKSTDELISSSSKLYTTVSILEEIKYNNQKVIIFADRKETQKMLQKVIFDKFEIFPSIINGDTPTVKKFEGKSKLSRQQTIDNYQNVNGFNVIIMSPIAAGVGLNVTKANHIIHYTRHWNPAKEEQATDRAYRIGQQQDVHVYYPMAIFPDNMTDENGNKLKSFDEVLDQLLTRKKALASDALFPTEEFEVTPEEIFGNLFN